MQAISRERTNELLQNDGVALVEVLGSDKYQEYHLPGAINVPVGDGFDAKIQDAVPDKSTPVIVYCLNAECPASPTAGKRMDDLGYETVYDYEAGKVDWKEAGQPVET